MPLKAPVQSARNFRRFGLTPCAASLSVEGSRLARRPPRKRRVAAFTPRSETTIGTGLNSSKRDDIQTMDRHVFRVVVLRRNGTENRVKQMAHSVADRCRSISPVWAWNPLQRRRSGQFSWSAFSPLVTRSNLFVRDESAIML